jgi:hypothetical protein
MTRLNGVELFSTLPFRLHGVGLSHRDNFTFFLQHMSIVKGRYIKPSRITQLRGVDTNCLAAQEVPRLL